MQVAIDVSQVIYGTGVGEYNRHLVQELVNNTPLNLTLFGGSLRRQRELNRWLNTFPDKVKKKSFLLPPFLADILANKIHLSLDPFLGKFDILHTSDWAQYQTTAKKVTTIHDLSFLKDPTWSHPKIVAVHQSRLKWVKKEVDQIIAVSESTKTDIVDLLDITPERITVVHEGPAFTQSPEISSQRENLLKHHYKITKPFFIVLGSGHPRKNLKRIIQAVSAANLDHQVVIIGNPRGEEVLLANSDVIFTGFVSDQEMAELTKLSQGLLYPSLYEGFGIPILNAFVCGVPVLTSNLSSMPEVAGSAAVLVDPQDVESIQNGILTMVNSKKKLIQLGKEQLKKFSWVKCAQETYQVYQDIFKA